MTAFVITPQRNRNAQEFYDARPRRSDSWRKRRTGIVPWDDRSTSMRLVPRRVLDQMREQFAMRQPDKIISLLEPNKLLAEIVLEANAALDRYFPDTIRALELTPNAGSEHREQLFLSVITQLDVDEALARVQRFDEEWWIDRSRSLRLRIDLEIDVTFE